MATAESAGERHANDENTKTFAGRRSCEFAFRELRFIRCRFAGADLVRVISKTRLRQFWTGAGRGDAEGPLKAWFAHVNSRSVSWKSWGDLKADFPHASLVGRCVVFNIGGNKYRLVVRILYPSHKVLVLKVMTHREYDSGQWTSDCGCFDAPKKRPPAKARSQKDQPPRREQE
jgi:mRNA interferase HigB